MRILIVADNASTRFGGEAFLPYNYFRMLRERGIDVRLLVHERNKSDLIGLFPNDVERLYFVKDSGLHKLAFLLGRLLPRRVAELSTGFVIQLSTQLAQRSMINRLLERYDLDVVHVPTPVSPKTPSLLYGFRAPVVFGPLNGGMEYPEAFRKEESWLTRFFVWVGRNAADTLNLLIPGKRRAKLVLVANDRTRGALPRGVQGEVIELVENGVDLRVWSHAQRQTRSEAAVKFVSVGRLVNWKALDIALQAIKLVADGAEIKFEVIGAGPMLETWRSLSEQLDLSSIVTFSGWLSQSECAVRLRQADVLLLPSLFESGGAVVLEAMAMGLPVVATAWGGPLDYLDESCGILIPPISRESMVADFADAIKRLAQSPSLREQLGRSGHDKVKANFDWGAKISKILDIYSLAAKRQ